MKAATRGNVAALVFGRGKVVSFTAGGKKRYEIQPGYVIVNGEIRMADGTEAFALLEFDELSSGEHSGTGIFIPDKDVIVFLDEEGSLDKLGKTTAEVFPYRYRYHVQLSCSDHHVGDDGWSLAGWKLRR